MVLIRLEFKRNIYIYQKCDFFSEVILLHKLCSSVRANIQGLLFLEFNDNMKLSSNLTSEQSPKFGDTHAGQNGVLKSHSGSSGSFR